MKILVQSAVKLDADSKKELEALFAKKYGKDYSMTEEIDASVIGGLRITVGSNRIDTSLAGKLSQVQEQLE